jgi:hypothetical protein
MHLVDQTGDYIATIVFLEADLSNIEDWCQPTVK